MMKKAGGRPRVNFGSVFVVEAKGKREIAKEATSHSCTSLHSPAAKATKILSLDAGASWHMRLVGDASALSWHDSRRFAKTVLAECGADRRCVRPW